MKAPSHDLTPQDTDTESITIGQAKEVLQIEAQSILSLQDRIGGTFEKAVDMILQSKGRVILTGMGKSGLVARKIAATLNSTGTTSLFLHPAEAIHGDLGMVTHDDIVLAVSNSGHTAEINTIIPILKDIGARIVSFVGELDSPLAELSFAAIDVGVEREACPMGLAPTASTTAALAMGDALAVALINRRRFNPEDFKRFHPGGSLGERLTVKVSQVMLTGSRIPMIPLGASVTEAIEEMERKGIGATLVVDQERTLEGIITDGDLRRAIMKHGDIISMRAQEIMSSSPKTIYEDQTAAEALGIMELHVITHLAVMDRHRQLNGVIHLHDVLGKEDFKVNGGIKGATGSDR